MCCLEYLVSANSSIAAKCELERRLIGQGGIWLHSRKSRSGDEAGSGDVQVAIRLRSAVGLVTVSRRRWDGLASAPS